MTATSDLPSAPVGGLLACRRIAIARFGTAWPPRAASARPWPPDWTRPKIIWPAIGAVLFVVPGGITKSSLAAGWVPGVRDVLGAAVLFVVLGFQVGALVLAGRGPGAAATAGGAGTKPDRETTARSD